MVAGALYGMFLGIVLSLLDRWDNPVAWAGYWAVQTILLTICTTLTWRRTRLLWVTADTADAALVSAAFVPASLAGYTLRNLPSPWGMLFWVDAAALVLSHLLCWLIYRDEFRRWNQHMEAMSLRDVLMFRHIPHLR